MQPSDLHCAIFANIATHIIHVSLFVAHKDTDRDTYFPAERII